MMCAAMLNGGEWSVEFRFVGVSCVHVGWRSLMFVEDWCVIEWCARVWGERVRCVEVRCVEVWCVEVWCVEVRWVEFL